MIRLHRPRPRGLTIIELMTVLVVLGVLISVVAPSMRSMMQRQRVQGVHDQLITDLQLARSELALRGDAAPGSVAVTFGGNATLTCYTIHTDTVPSSVGPGVNCDCTRNPGAACVPAGGVLREIRTHQVTRALGVSLAASSPSGMVVTFKPPQGLATPPDLRVTVQGDVSGQLRTSIGALGSTDVCSPDGSMRGVPRCP